MFYILNAHKACFSIEPDVEAYDQLNDEKLIGCTILGDEHKVINYINSFLSEDKRRRPDKVSNFKGFCEEHGYKVFFIEREGKKFRFKNDVSNKVIEERLENFIHDYRPSSADSSSAP